MASVFRTHFPAGTDRPEYGPMEKKDSLRRIFGKNDWQDVQDTLHDCGSPEDPGIFAGKER